MLKYIDSNKMGNSNLGWLNSTFHFSFAEYYNPNNINFGVLRVINDDLIAPGTGFDTHPHRDMEIISYVVDGEITHADSMNNKRTLTRGQVQYMSAGTGVYHSEHNFGANILRLLQIWILPDENGHTPNYGDCEFKLEDRENKWLHMVTSRQNLNDVPIKINADINMYSTIITSKNTSNFSINVNRQAYLVLIEGSATINNIILNQRDGLEVVEENLEITTLDCAHILIIEMAKS